ncbi:SdrD B-like domain-containing protein [Henriciella litoralis]|uniref:SdrD B-like domain-containing protein n=1 Tax=Henriciella litoralis TaxID=568102 RepID=UPI000A047E5B|nr:SdrD B-like domain-containing protein [Henriciella litoralis]
MVTRPLILALAALTLLPLMPVATAQESGVNVALRTTQPADLSPPQSVPDPVAATKAYIDVEVAGARLSVPTRHADGKDSRTLIDAAPIAQILGSRFEVSDNRLTYYRPQDDAVMTLNFGDGEFRANDMVLGKLPEFQRGEESGTWLEPKTIAVITGTTLLVEADGTYTFELQKGLRPQSELDLWVNGRPVDTFGAKEPRTIGPVLLVPLEPITQALGHQLTLQAGMVQVIRAQDTAVISLELATGLITVNGTPRGVSPNMSFAEPSSLLLPFSAVEALTGTHISLSPGSNRIDVRQDDRLGGAALPPDRGAAGAGGSPFTPEALSYLLSDRGPNRAEFSSRWGRYNSRLTYESAGGLEALEELQPSWMSLDVQSLDGWAGSVGDYSGRFRETAGVDVSRVRGLSWRRKTDGGDILAVSAGTMLTGAETISEHATKPEFGGFAGGVRLLDKDGSQEIGVAARVTAGGDDTAIVGSVQKVIEPKGTFGNLQTAYVSVDGGYFDGAETGFDVRGRGELRFAMNDQWTVSISGQHDGEKFQASRDATYFGGVFDNRVGARTTGAISTDWRSAKSWGILQYVSVGARASINQIDGPVSTTTHVYSASLNTKIGASGPDLAVDVEHSRAFGDASDETMTDVRVRAYQRFDWGSLQANYLHLENGTRPSNQAVAIAQSNPLQKSFKNGAFVSVAPAATVTYTDGDARFRAGGAAAFSSGLLLDEKLELSGQVWALSNFEPEAAATRYYANLEARYRVGRRTEIVASYFDDLEGRNDFSIALRGTIEFNEPRRQTLPLADRGVLTGRVFVDLNRDGVRQADEPGLAGAQVEVRGTQLSHAADRDGDFEIENVKEGLFGLSINQRSLPLGYRVQDAELIKASVAEGRRTTVDIPVIQSGQLRGAVFIDMDGNGIASHRDERLEGQPVRLLNLATNASVEVPTASFGQYGFENLEPGDYRLFVMVGWEEYAVDVKLTEDAMLQIVPIAIPPEVFGVTPAQQVAQLTEAP